MTSSTSAAVERLHTLPALPIVVAEILQSMGNDEVPVAPLLRALEHDPALASAVLRLANSPYFGMRGRIATIHDAVTVLGLRALRSLVVASGLRSCFQSPPANNDDLVRCWEHSFETAIAAKELSRGTRISPDTAFMAGLLHDIGKLAMWSINPEWGLAITAWCVEHGGSWSEAERAITTPSHAAIGFELARRWNLPDALCNAIAMHDAHCNATLPLTVVVHVADALSVARAYLRRPVFRVSLVDPTAWAKHGIDAPSVLRAARALCRATDVARIMN